MSNEFNPYYEWLGIPPKHQPADHYRLLGIEQFEADPVVVEHAADQRLGFLRTLQTGVRGKIANQLLNEVSQAKTILLDAEKRKTYDATLQSQKPIKPPPTAPPAKPPRTASRRRTNRSARSANANKEPSTEKWVAQLGIKRFRILACLLSGVIVILLASAFRSKPLTVRVYEDKNGNGRYDDSEGINGLGVGEILSDGSMLVASKISYETSEEGTAYLVLPKGDYNIGVLRNRDRQGNQYKVLGANSVPASTGGLRLFSPSIEFQVRHIKTITIKGHLFTRETARKPQGWKGHLYIDLDGNGIWNRGKEPVLKPNPEGKFEITLPQTAMKTKSVLRLTSPPKYHQDPGAISLPIDEAKDGVLKIANELKRKRMSIQGTLSVLPEGESPEGFIVYMDRNQNDVPDDNEPKTQTDAQGNYQWAFRHFDNASPETLKIQPAKGNYYRAIPHSTPRMNLNKSQLTVAGAHFRITKKRNPDRVFTAQGKALSKKTILKKSEGEAKEDADREAKEVAERKEEEKAEADRKRIDDLEKEANKKSDERVRSWFYTNFKKSAQKWRTKDRDDLNKTLTEVSKLKVGLQKVLSRTQSALKENPQLHADLRKAQKNKSEFKTKKEPASNRIARIKKVTQALEKAQTKTAANQHILRKGKADLAQKTNQLENALGSCRTLEKQILQLRNHPNTQIFMQSNQLLLAPFSSKKLAREINPLEQMLKRAHEIQGQLENMAFLRQE